MVALFDFFSKRFPSLVFRKFQGIGRMFVRKTANGQRIVDQKLLYAKEIVKARTMGPHSPLLGSYEAGKSFI